MKLKDLVKGAPGVRFSPPELELEVSGLSDDSRNVKPGDLFGSLPSTGGVNPERARYEAQALAHGAVAVLKAADTRLVWARICANFYGRPADKLSVAGITGTNGKTTTAYLLRSIFEEAGKPCALLGTVGYFIGKKKIEAPNTTPGALELTLLFDQAVKAKMEALVMEVSSHALEQYRVEGMAYDAAIFTNLTQDHLDYHKTMEAYLRAKMRLFGLLKTGGAAVVNADDPAGKQVAKARKPGSRLIGFSAAGKKTELTASEIKFSSRETKFSLNWEGKGHLLRIPLPGRFNVSNALAAAGAALGMGIPMATVLKALKAPTLPPGRFELVDAGQDFQVVVDYAHTPDALERVLKTAREITDGRLIVVFGCGGDRDKTKRPKMGAIAAKLADLCIVTSDNPRSEDPEAILDEIVAGMPKKPGEIQTVLRLADRASAIARAVKLAKAGDTVLLAGKGHEDYQVLAKGKVHFSDQESATAAVKAAKRKKAEVYPFSAARLAQGLKGRLLSPGRAKEFKSVSTDTRSLKKGDVYLALQGPNFDGERFFKAAIKAGAAALVGKRPPQGKHAAIQVKDGLNALQALASDQRRLMQGPVVAITGSNGKTGTKECLAHLLGDAVLATPGNWNNHIGLPLTLLKLEPRHQALVLEMGMNHSGELALLTSICNPDIALELNVGDAHLGYFKTRSGVASAKEELLQGLRGTGIAVLNGDDPLVAAMGRRFLGRKLSFGFGAKNDLQARVLADHGAAGARLRLSWQGTSRELRLPMGGRARSMQALASIAGGLAASRNLESLIERLKSFRPISRGRQQLERFQGTSFILDTYNASPQSMDAAFDLLELSAPKGKRLALLGDMLELGSASKRLHLELGRRAKKAGLRALGALGPQAKDTLRGFGNGTGRAFGRSQAFEAAAWLKANLKAGDWVLLKGSRGMAVERVFSELTRKG